ncbi:MAG: hypothetical protein JW814_10295 [Candidatus Krumholzibacteriota bacterium]|nr:hypothetical protein [Candidatus Krumholzibacteriota bacterium]
MPFKQSARQYNAGFGDGEFELLPGMGDRSVYGLADPGRDERCAGEHLNRCVAASYVKGYQKGLEEARVWKEQSMREVRELVDNAAAVIHSFQNVYERELLRLAVGIAEKVIRREVAAETVETLGKHIKSCLKLIDRETIIKLKLNHSDIRLISELFGIDQTLHSIFEKTIIEEDPEIERGGCIIETEGGTLRATISGQIEQLSEVLRSEHGKSDRSEMEPASTGA